MPRTTAVGSLRCALIAAAIGLWAIGAATTPSMWLPTPLTVASRLISWTFDGTFPSNGVVTIVESVGGLLIGAACAVAIGLILGYYGWLRKAVYPIAVFCYSVPLAALAPPFTAALGLGLPSKIALAATTAFFLIFFSVLSGAEAIDRRLTGTLQVMGASNRELLLKLFLPASREWILTGLRLAGPFSLLTAITAEIWGSRSGLGFLVKRAVETTDMTGVYATLVVLALIGVAINAIPNLLERSEA